MTDEPRPATGDEEWVSSQELPDSDFDEDEAGEDWDDPDDDAPILMVGT
jgi:hypothetical protein